MAKRKPKTNQPVSLCIAQLVEDMDIYPRHAVDESNVQSLADAIRSGAQLPPIIADSKSKRITDGWHRVRAYKRVSGPEAVADVLLVPYKDEAEMRFDAVVRNAQHGRRLDSVDRTRSIIMLRASKFSDEKIGMALNIPVKRIAKIALRVASASTNAKGLVPGTSQITLKRSVRHLAGKNLTKAQAEAHGTMPGTTFLLIARQLTMAIRNDMVNRSDEKLIAELELLRDELSNWL